jgi:hypothetical protein
MMNLRISKIRNSFSLMLISALAFMPGLIRGAEFSPTDVKITKLGTNANNLNWISFTGSQALAVGCRYQRVYFDFSTVQGKAFQASLLSSQTTGVPLFQITYADGQTLQGNTDMCILMEVVTRN